jgi:hypothetical protein
MVWAPHPLDIQPLGFVIVQQGPQPRNQSSAVNATSASNQTSPGGTRSGFNQTAGTNQTTTSRGGGMNQTTPVSGTYFFRSRHTQRLSSQGLHSNHTVVHLSPMPYRLAPDRPVTPGRPTPPLRRTRPRRRTPRGVVTRLAAGADASSSRGPRTPRRWVVACVTLVVLPWSFVHGNSGTIVVCLCLQNISTMCLLCLPTQANATSASNQTSPGGTRSGFNQTAGTNQTTTGRGGGGMNQTTSGMNQTSAVRASRSRASFTHSYATCLPSPLARQACSHVLPLL